MCRCSAADYPTPDGTGVRDYLHVEDLASAHLRALDYLRPPGRSVTLNVGYGHGYSVREVLAMVETVGGKPLVIREEARRAGDPAYLVARAERIQDRTRLAAALRRPARHRVERARLGAQTSARALALMRCSGSLGPLLDPPKPLRFPALFLVKSEYYECESRFLGPATSGLVTGACLADAGNHVVCVDVDERKIEMLKAGDVPIHEPGLDGLVKRNSDAGRLRFTTDAKEGVDHGQFQLIAVGTPPG